MPQYVSAIGLLLLCTASFTEALKCMICYCSNFEDCDIRGHVTECQQNQHSCQTTIRRYQNKLTVEKRCKDTKACRNNQMQNGQSSGRSTQCNTDQRNSFCACCCDTDVCNGGVPSCYKADLPVHTVNDCPVQDLTFPHGKMNCFGDKKRNEVCQYECTGHDYSLHPKGRDTNVCTSNSTWSIERPCCARPCPPYLLLDSIFLFNYESEELGRTQIVEWMTGLVEWEVIAWDATQESVLYFSGQPQLDTRVTFADSNFNGKKFAQLVNERMHPVNQGPVNYGAAIRYAMNNMFTEDAGARDSRVPKAIELVSDQNPTDPTEAIAAGREAMDLGIILYIFAFDTGTISLNKELLLEIVGGVKDHLYIFDVHFQNTTEAHFADMQKHFCADPCRHVLHEHN